MKLTRRLLAGVLGALVALPNLSFAQEEAPNPEEIFKKLDKNGDGKLTPDEIGEEQKRSFERMVRVGDKDGNGELSREEFLEASRRSDRPAGAGERPAGERERPAGERPAGDRRAGGRPGFGEELFNRLDTNGDGKISVDEAPERGKEMVRNLLRRAGKEPGDSLTKEEFAKLTADQRPGEGRPEQRPEGGFRGPRFFMLLDADKDGRISKEELAKAAEMFDELDTNKNGTLEPAELMGFPPGGPGRDRRPDSARPEGARPEGRRPEGARPEGRRPEGARPEGRRPEGRPGEERPRPEQRDKPRPE